VSTTQELRRAVRDMIRNDPDVARAHSAMRRRRGLSKQDAQDELARGLIGCMWETWRGMPNRWCAVLQALAQGTSAAALFPDELYEPDGGSAPS
jgi:hypothetical protein